MYAERGLVAGIGAGIGAGAGAGADTGLPVPTNSATVGT